MSALNALGARVMYRAQYSVMRQYKVEIIYDQTGCIVVTIENQKNLA